VDGDGEAPKRVPSCCPSATRTRARHLQAFSDIDAEDESVVNVVAARVGVPAKSFSEDTAAAAHADLPRTRRAHGG
jgi:hypothetical protein